MKRSAQVALVLMGVTGATAAGAYMMPARSAECRQPAQTAPAAAPVPGATPRAQEEPCRRRRSWGSWHWGSGSYSYDRRRNSTIAPTTAFRSRPASGTRNWSSPSSSTSSSSSSSTSSRGGFGSTGHSGSHSSGG